MEAMDNRPRHYAIYKNPSDFKGKYVLRRWIIDVKPIPDKIPIAVSESIEEVREHIPSGYINIGRQPEDDVSILEVWV